MVLNSVLHVTLVCRPSPCVLIAARFALLLTGLVFCVCGSGSYTAPEKLRMAICSLLLQYSDTRPLYRQYTGAHNSTHTFLPLLCSLVPQWVSRTLSAQCACWSRWSSHLRLRPSGWSSVSWHCRTTRCDSWLVVVCRLSCNADDWIGSGDGIRGHTWQIALSAAGHG